MLIVAVLAITGHAQVKSAKLQASGLTCAMCARSVYKNLEALKFISSIDTDLNGSSFILKFKEGQKVDIDAIKKKVEDAGFGVAVLEVTAAFQGTTVKQDTHVQVDGTTFHFVGVKDQVLNGDQTFRVIDKNFVLQKESKKYQAMTKMECYKTGVAGSCCEKDGISSDARIYHVTI
jgi:copper chaperone CopZ